MNRFVRLSAVLLFIFNVLLVPSSFAQPSTAKLASLKLAKNNGIPNQYIVVMKDGPSANAGSVAQAVGVTPKHTYSAALNGFSATLNAGQLKAIRSNPNVDYVEQDQVVKADVTQLMDANGDPWGLDRIDQRNLPLSGSYTYYLTGAGVNAYIIDTGILATHPDFGVRAFEAYDAVDGALPATDCNGHGTHVAGTIGGTTYGVAKAVKLYGVRVLNCAGSGTWADVIEGIDWVRLNAIRPAVVNMSLGGGVSAAVNTATTNLINSGIFTAVAAGNSNADACTFSPASTPLAYTVAASTKTDAKAIFSNWGTCVDSYAPGEDIKSAWLANGTNTIDGTSMASPHVAGCAATFIQHNGNVPPAAVTAWLTNNATNGVITGNPAGTPNKLLYCFKPDVWVKDKSVDQGREPDPATAAMNMWESPDIWNRINNTAGSHQNPEFGQTNYMWTRLRNRGHIAGSGVVRFYIANASSGLAWPTNWTQIGAVSVPSIAPNAIMDVRVPWNPPSTGHYCVLVRWESALEPMTYGETSDVNYNTRYNNNIAWRNMNIVNLKLNWRDWIRFEVRNPLKELRPTTLVFREPREQLQDPFLRHGKVTVDLGTELTQRWLQAGGKGRGFQRVGETQFMVTDPNGAAFEGLNLEPDQAFPVQIGIESNEVSTSGKPYLIEAVQFSEGIDEAVGGVTYEVYLPTQTAQPTAVPVR
ncbi:MAG TPA: S8 family peptidase [Herpetosiphonaceae bacterium]